MCRCCIGVWFLWARESPPFFSVDSHLRFVVALSLTGWLGLGFSPSMTMITSNVVVAMNTTSVQTYQITAKDAAAGFTAITSLNITNAAVAR